MMDSEETQERTAARAKTDRQDCLGLQGHQAPMVLPAVRDQPAQGVLRGALVRQARPARMAHLEVKVFQVSLAVLATRGRQVSQFQGHQGLLDPQVRRVPRVSWKALKN